MLGTTLFIVYTITDTVYYSDYCSPCIRLLLLLLSSHCPSILVKLILIVLTELNNNVNGQLTLGMGKLIEETVSVF